MTSAGAIKGSDTRVVDMHVDRRGSKLSGWATPADPLDDGEDLTVRLVAGSVLLGRLRRDRARPDAAWSGEATAKIGFEVPDHGLAAFACMTGLDGVAISVEGGPAAPIEWGAAASVPLGMRHALGKALRLVDLWVEGSRNLTLRFEGRPTTSKSLDAYQHIGAKLVNVALDRPLRGSDPIVTMSLLNPFEPVLVVFKGEDEAIDAVDFVPFPSLARGGFHAAERLIAAHGADDVSDMAAVSADLTGAWIERAADPSRCVTSMEIDAAVETGMEPVLNRDLLAWLAGRLGIRVTPAPGSAHPAFVAEILGASGKKRAAGGHTLHLPADCIPTLAALLRPLPADADAKTLTGGFAISEWNRHGRVWSVWQPALPRELDSLQFDQAPQFAPSVTIKGSPSGTGRAVALQWPLAIALREQPTRIGHSGPFEIAADKIGPLLRAGKSGRAGKLSVLVLGASSTADPARLLESLVRQEGVEIGELLVCASTEDGDDLGRTVTRTFAARHQLIPVAATAGRLEQIAAARETLGGGRVLLVDAATVVTDERTLAILMQMLDVPAVGSAGCLLRSATKERALASAGYSFSHIDLRGAPAVSFSGIDPAVWRGPCTYAVVANSMGLLLTSHDVLGTLDPAGSTAMRPESDDLLLGMHLISQGRLNLCTTVVSAYTSVPARPSQAAISVPYRLRPDELERIAQSSTIVQRVA